MSVSAYKKTMRETETPRSIERRIFSRITAELSKNVTAFDEAESETARRLILTGSLQPALVENTRLWNALRADLGHPDNQLPDELRAQLISLALFVDRQTTAVLGGTGKLAALVAINKAIIEGLAGLLPNNDEAA